MQRGIIVANGKILRQLIRAGTIGDSEAFRLASEAVIQDERQKQHHLLANDLEQILYGEHLRPLKQNGRNTLPTPPVDKERGLPLLDVRQAQRPIEEMVLPESSIAPIEELLEEHRRVDVLRSFGMKPSGKIIFHGPPGCGKTLAAEVIAFELDLPLSLIHI